MNKYLFVLILLAVVNIFNSTLNAQDKELSIKYRFERRIPSFTGDQNIHKTPLETELYADANGVISRTPLGVSFNGVSPYVSYVHKDFKKNTILSIENMSKIKVVLKEELNLFNWKLSTETKEILGYNCFKAACSFRGRDYVAYFTKDIPIKAAPWKFHGLPGVILEVFSTDDFCCWTAQSLDISSEKSGIEFSEDGLTRVNFKQYVRILKKDRAQRKEAQNKAKLMYENSGLNMKIIDLNEAEIEILK